MKWTVEFLPEAEKDLLDVDNSTRRMIKKTINHAQDNPLPKNEGGKGIPLGNKFNINLTGFYELKLRGIGIRVIYKLKRTDNLMKIIVIGARKDEEAYIQAQKRIDKYGL
jgi:mRNA interferase RelE/StbE